MIRALYRTQAGHTRTDLKLEAVAMALGDDSGLLWVDLADESPSHVPHATIGRRRPGVDSLLMG
jgi:hypothetical protein